jgi:uncharacterized protein
VKVRVLEVNEALKRISLSMKSPDAAPAKPQDHGEANRGEKSVSRQRGKKPDQSNMKKPERKKEEHHFTLDDLKAKFR